MNTIFLSKLTAIKIIHTISWGVFTGVFFYMAYAVITNKIDKYVWLGIALFSLELIVLLVFKNNCPLTIIARRYSISIKDNFDIYLPNWLAKYNKVIYAVFAIIFVCGLAYRILNF